MYGRCTVSSAVLRGVEALMVDVEVVVSSGLPNFCIVGMADAAVQESKERVRAALRSSGFSMPGDRVVVNLAPSSLKKSGSGLDLAIAMGILVCTGQVDAAFARNTMFIGELSLDGGVRAVAGMLAYGLKARQLGCRLVCSTQPDGLIAMEGLDVSGLARVADLREEGYRPVRVAEGRADVRALDFSDVSGHEMVKRALQIAAAGNHGVLMMGPPGSGKTMLASRMPSIMPELSEDERLQAALVYSVAGEDSSGILSGVRPFRAPHHSATSAGLIGGGSPVRPGEISLAHCGVLMLDELPEFKPSVLQQLRQPLEDGCVCISRADGTIVFPARFMLVAASNPCRCGYFGDPKRACTCTERQVMDYQNRIGGPLVDRIDLHIDVRRLAPEEILARKGGATSSDLREGVLRAREYRSWRERDGAAPLSTKGMMRACRMSEEDEAFFRDCARANNMSGRSMVRTMSVARTIADMAEKERVGRAELSEAMGFRVREGVGR